MHTTRRGNSAGRVVYSERNALECRQYGYNSLLAKGFDVATTFQEGTCYTYQDLKFYAMNGFVCLHDQEDGDFRVITRKEWLERADALSSEIKRLRKMATTSTSKAFYDDACRLQKFVEDMIACAMEAGHQGDHTDPKVSAWFQKHRPWARGRSKGSHDPAKFDSKKPGALPVGNFTGRTTGAPDRSQRPRGQRPLVTSTDAPPVNPRLRKLILPSDVL
jgi:hypothetical protein